MARMIGAAQWYKECPYGCCRSMIPRSSAKSQEKAGWRKEADEELAHGVGFCGDYYCPECGADEDFDFNPPEDLQGIPNVLYEGKEPPSFDFSTI